MSGSTVYIGIDPTAGTRPITYAVLNSSLKVLALETAPLEDVIEAVLAYPQAVCGMDAPIGPNSGLMATPGYRARLSLDPGSDLFSTYRVGEYELRRRGIYIYNTPQEEEKLTDWVITAWGMYDQLRAAGYVEYPRPGSRRMFETYPHGAFTVLLKLRPYTKLGVEGRLQRQAALYQEGVDVPDPMYVLQEWTRHRLLTGQLDFDHILTHDELDALVAAYTAFIVDREPQNMTAVGDPAEGMLIVPTGTLLDEY